ncbi:MAG: uroporphyrinogen-III synthase [Bacteroidetes bacterium MED-G17]|nr:MAG: uroporphyrinogen-III synthase [Bacteroidetes bacterium TMED39]PDH52555.1 MAG: uroporphyrinogen-III synthase [Bacteroidetes bacterium MED-G17]CAI8274894.1 MAG: Uncharacterised protein [Bacteroidetes bacterium MED-G17]|tara:strand:- start:15019 stop:15762 length:744 start_codon:yes stop_codon:yes gene_type:complete
MSKKIIKTILISQPDPGDKKSSFDKLKEVYKLHVEFRPFIQLEQISGKELRKKRLIITDFSAIILTSRNAVDNFFRVVDELKVELPTTTKYFCLNEGISMYMQKYTILRKRKLYVSHSGEKGLLELIKTQKKEQFLFPCSNIRQETIPNFMQENDIVFKDAIMYKTVNADLSDLANVYYDIIVFFSPAGIKSLFENFPDFKQNDTLIAGWGKTTDNAIKKAGLVNNIPAPQPDVPSMVAAIEKYIKK